MNYQVQTPTEIDMYSKPLEKRKVTVCIMARELHHATSISNLSPSKRLF